MPDIAGFNLHVTGHDSELAQIMPIATLEHSPQKTRGAGRELGVRV